MCGCCLCRNEKKSNPSFFPAFARESTGGVDLFFRKDDDLSLYALFGGIVVFGGRFPKRSLKRERERERQTDVFSDLPKNKGKRERRPTLDFTQQKEVQKRGKKKRIDSQNISKKEKERERKRVFFLRKERHFSSFLSLLSLTSEGGAS